MGDKIRYIEEIDFSIRTYNLIKRGGVNTEEELLNMTLGEVKQIRHMSYLAVKEIISTLSSTYIDNIISIMDKDNYSKTIRLIISEIKKD